MFHGRFLVRGEGCDVHSTTAAPKSKNNDDTNVDGYIPMIVSDTPISFWGGIDPLTGRIIDTQHPLYDTNIRHTIFCIPSTRGSCTTSQVLLELLLHHIAPHTIVVRDYDALLCIGALIAQECFQNTSQKCNIIHIGSKQYEHLLQLSSISSQQKRLYGRLSSDGYLDIQDHRDGASIESNPSVTVQNTADDLLVLTDEEQHYMEQCTTDAERMALRVIFRCAKLSFIHESINDSNDINTIRDDDNQKNSTDQHKQYIPIEQAHIDGCTYIGPGGIQFVQLLQQLGGKVRVPTTLNSVSTDQRYWAKYSVPKEYAKNSITLANAYVALGCEPTFTCAPYLLLSLKLKASRIAGTTTPQNKYTATLMGKDIAWGESNAVVYANSVLGARTEKYADYLDICCAIAGIVPKIGVHNQHQRLPTMVIDGTMVFESIQSLIGQNNKSRTTILDLDVLFPILGHLCGRLSDGHVPLLVGFEKALSYWRYAISTDHLKAFCAAFGTTASSPLIHIAGITPEAKDPATIERFVSSCPVDRTRTIHIMDLHETYQNFNTKNRQKSVDLVALGNPHLSVSECSTLASIILELEDNSSSNKAKTRIIACISRIIYEQANTMDIWTMQEFGVEFVFDTCWCMLLDEPIIPHNPLATILTNSGKYAHYGPGLTNRPFRFGSMYDCIYAAKYGYIPKRNSRIGEPTNDTMGTQSNAIAQQLSFLRRPPQVHSSLYQKQSARRYSTQASMRSFNQPFLNFERSSSLSSRRKMIVQAMLFLMRKW